MTSGHWVGWADGISSSAAPQGEDSWRLPCGLPQAICRDTANDASASSTLIVRPCGANTIIHRPHSPQPWWLWASTVVGGPISYWSNLVGIEHLQRGASKVLARGRVISLGGGSVVDAFVDVRVEAVAQTQTSPCLCRCESERSLFGFGNWVTT